MAADVTDQELNATTPKPSHVYYNIKTKQTWYFYFVKSQAPFIFDLITTEGIHIGEWNKKTRMFYMEYGLSNYLIKRIEDHTPPKETASDRDDKWIKQQRKHKERQRKQEEALRNMNDSRNPKLF